uniref:EGF-like domain-containing protein n=1 Tax=Cacopsylla melanoneura TaxID=428564 RepID=A0A8D9BJY5_9HEMI
MHLVPVFVVPVLCTLVLLVHLTTAFEDNQTRQGCRIADNTCICGKGLYSEYRYSNREECMKALKGKLQNGCDGDPCYHGGRCTQTFQDNKGYKCRCAGTGYYGKKCQFPCPSNFESVASFPYECIII